MDKGELKKILLPFEQLGAERSLPFHIERLDDPTSGLERGQYVVRIVAPWAAGKSFDETMDPLLDLLWDSTDEKTRGAISSIVVAPSVEALDNMWLVASA